MNNSTLTDLTEDERRLLRHEEYMAQLLKHREPGAGPSKPPWQRFLESAGGAAMVTVIIGGIFGAIISAQIQSSAKDREFRQSWLKAEGDQALEAYKDYLGKQQEVVKHIYERIGISTSVADDLISLSKLENATTSYSGDQRERVRKYRDDVMDKYTVGEEAWRTERDGLGLLINYYHPKQEGVIRAWQSLQDSVTTYMRCAEKWHYDHAVVSDTVDISTVCSEQKMNFRSALNELNKSLEASRTYLWEGWESPDKLRAVLDKH